MAEFVFINGKVLVDGDDFSANYNQMELSLSAEQLDKTTFGDSGRERRPGLFDFSANYTGFWSNSTAEVSSTSNATPDGQEFNRIGSTGTTHALTFSAVAASTGNVCYITKGVQADLQRGGSVGELGTVTGNFQSKGERVVRAEYSLSDTSITASTEGPVIDLGAVSATQSLYGALHVVNAGSTTGTIDVIVVSDATSTFGSASTQLTFSQLTAAGGEFQSQAGAITDTAYRVEVTIGGSSPDFHAIVSLGVV